MTTQMRCPYKRAQDCNRDHSCLSCQYVREPTQEHPSALIGLLACPFCGGVAEQQDHGVGEVSIGCDNCDYFLSGDGVTGRWNTRTK